MTNQDYLLIKQIILLKYRWLVKIILIIIAMNNRMKLEHIKMNLNIILKIIVVEK